jgi:hypothetical protein
VVEKWMEREMRNKKKESIIANFVMGIVSE